MSDRRTEGGAGSRLPARGNCGKIRRGGWGKWGGVDAG